MKSSATFWLLRSPAEKHRDGPSVAQSGKDSLPAAYLCFANVARTISCSVNVAAAVDAAALACLDAGRADLARALVASVRPELRACAIKIALLVNDGLDEAIDMVLEGVECASRTDTYDPTVHGWAARALALSAVVEGKSERAAELVRPADEVIDAFFAGQRRWEDLARVLQTQLALGKRRDAQRVLKKWFRQDAESVAKGLQQCPALITAFSEDAEMTLRLIQSIDSSSDRSRVVEEFIGHFAHWSLTDLDKLMHMVEHLQWPVYRALREAGRDDEARRVLSEFEPHEQDHRGQVERHLELGENEAADRLLCTHATDDVVLATMALQRGLDTLEQTWPRYASREPEGEIMAVVTNLIALVEHALDQGYDRARYQPILDAIEKLLAADFRTSYDQARALAAIESLAGESAHAKLLGARDSHDGTLLVDGSSTDLVLAPLWAALLR